MKKNSNSISVDVLDLALRSLLGDYQDYSIKLAYSGGLDSQVLLHLLSQLRAFHPFDLQAIHVHHGVHTDADHWAELCVANCRALDIPLSIEKVTVSKKGIGFEAAAREARYESLSRHITKKQEVLLTAHHLNDQAETLLLHLLRGAGVKGVAAMPAVRKFGHGQLCRPLLETSRAQILEYAESNNLQWIEDESNQDPDIRRSFLRQQIFPILNDHWPEASTTLARTAQHMAEADRLLDYLAETDLVGRLDPSTNRLLISKLAELAADRLRNVLRYWMHKHGLNAPSTRQLEELLKLIFNAPNSGSAALEWGNQYARIYRNELWLGIDANDNDHAEEFVWDLKTNSSINFGNQHLSIVDCKGKGLAKTHTGTTLIVRYRQGGERCRLPGKKHRTTLKNLLQQEGMPPWERKALPLIYVGDQLAAVGDRWVCEPFAAGENEPGWQLKMAPIQHN